MKDLFRVLSTVSALLTTLHLAGCGEPPLSAETGGEVGRLDVFGDITAGTDPGVDGPTADGQNDDAPPVADASATSCKVPPFGLLCPCEFNNQCESGYCIAVTDDDVDQRCTRECQDECPEGYECQPLAGGVDPVYICIQTIDKLCDPCFSNADCLVPGDLCVQVESATYCARNCEDTPCPDGFSCTDIDGARQCLPDSGSCLCPPGVDLNSDPEHCGECGKPCELPNAIAGCEGGSCTVASCEDGYWDLDGAPSNGCEYACDKADDDDVPDPAVIDANCDGIDGDFARAVFVAPYGDDGAAGTAEAPVKTVQVALSKTDPQSGIDHVYLAAGTYEGQTVLADGVSLFGGFSADGNWTRSLTAYETILINSSADAGGAIRTLVGTELSEPITVSAITVQSGNNAGTGGSSYAVYLRETGGAVTLSHCRLVSGNGGPGSDGSDQPKAADGATGQPGKSTTDTDCNCNEFETYGGVGGAPGVATCNLAGAGGKGADSACGDDQGSKGSDAPDGTLGGQKEKPGSDGADGDDGSHGAGGSGGSVVGGVWLGADGLAGDDAANGKAGGGGGSGDGDPNGIFGCAIWGGGGGGGASAGCAGLGATGGTAGGGSFALFLVDSSPTVRDCELSPKNGGNGGNGGLGGQGGAGKTGGAGGTGHEGAGDGGKGGDSGSGGNGGNGGGGAGGPSYAIFLSGSASPKCIGNTFLPLGVGGVGGVGGNLDGNAGASGLYGSLNTAPTAACDPDSP